MSLEIPVEGRQKRSDTDLVNEAKGGRHEAFETLVERYAGMVFALGFARLHDRDSVEDFVQEVFLRIYLNLGQLQQPQYFGTWVGRLARNLATDWSRRGQRASRLLPMIAIEDAPEPATPEEEGARVRMEKSQEQELVHQALQQLSVEQREMVLLHFAEELNFEEIGRRLEIHPTTVSRNIDKGLKVMRKSLQPMMTESVRSFRIPASTTAKTLGTITLVAAMSSTSKAALAAAAGSTMNYSSGTAATQAGAGAAYGWGFLKSVAGWFTAGSKMAVAAKAAVAGSMVVCAAGGTYVLVHDAKRAAGDPAHPSAAAIQFASGGSAEGYWLGTLRNVPRQGDVRVGFQIRTELDGTATGSMDSPDQGLMGIPLSRIEVNGNRVRFESDLIGASFEGTRSATGVLAGSWKQAGGALPLTVAQTTEPVKPKPRREKIEVQIDPAQLDQYVGQYALAPQFSIVVTKEGDHLVQQASKQPPAVLVAEAENRFFLREIDADYVFVKNSAGKVDALLLSQNGVTMRGRKIR